MANQDELEECVHNLIRKGFDLMPFVHPYTDLFICLAIMGFIRKTPFLYSRYQDYGAIVLLRALIAFASLIDEHFSDCQVEMDCFSDCRTGWLLKATFLLISILQPFILFLLLRKMSQELCEMERWIQIGVPAILAVFPVLNSLIFISPRAADNADLVRIITGGISIVLASFFIRTDKCTTFFPALVITHEAVYVPFEFLKYYPLEGTEAGNEAYVFVQRADAFCWPVIAAISVAILFYDLHSHRRSLSVEQEHVVLSTTAVQNSIV